MAKYLLLISLIVAGAGVATAGKSTSGGNGCKHACSLTYQATVDACAASSGGTGTTNEAFQQCAQQAVADYYSCVSLCH